MWKDIAAHCTTALMLKPRYIKPMVRRFRANNALGKTRDALLGERGGREGHTTHTRVVPPSLCRCSTSIGRGSTIEYINESDSTLH